MNRAEVWEEHTAYGVQTATLEPSWDDGWWVDMGCCLWSRWYKRKANAEKYLLKCGYTKTDKTIEIKSA